MILEYGILILYTWLTKRDTEKMYGELIGCSISTLCVTNLRAKEHEWGDDYISTYHDIYYPN